MNASPPPTSGGKLLARSAYVNPLAGGGWRKTAVGWLETGGRDYDATVCDDVGKQRPPLEYED
ncbi:MAG: hypothetical protein LBK66_02500 [Spirochaetaceae bacterium]|nr:hypothetical protein [Spirochaetaceae bacterium]